MVKRRQPPATVRANLSDVLSAIETLSTWTSNKPPDNSDDPREGMVR
jgi:hypothetical protein